jgi:hypothetical protein
VADLEEEDNPDGFGAVIGMKTTRFLEAAGQPSKRAMTSL